jgi:hypothetical protein
MAHDLFSVILLPFVLISDLIFIILLFLVDAVNIWNLIDDIVDDICLLLKLFFSRHFIFLI